MSSESAQAYVTDMDIDDWSDDEDEEESLGLSKNIDSRRQVENKLDDIRLAKEISEYDFDF